MKEGSYREETVVEEEAEDASDGERVVEEEVVGLKELDVFETGEDVVEFDDVGKNGKKLSEEERAARKAKLLRWKGGRAEELWKEFLNEKLDGVWAGMLKRPQSHRKMDIEVDDALMKKSNMKNAEKRIADGFSNRRKREEVKKKETAGTDWYDLPKPDLTPELLNDLKVLKMRQHLETGKHYKSLGWGPSGRPDFFQVGTIVDSNHDYLTGRINRKDRKQHLKDEFLDVEEVKQKAKRRYRETQAKNQAGRRTRPQRIQKKHRSKR